MPKLNQKEMKGIWSEFAEEELLNNMPKEDKTFNVCYLREYMDPEHQGDFFYAYETIYRNVPEKYRSKFDTQKMRMKILKHCDWNYKETATNFANSTRIELIDEKQYYQTYEDVFGDTAAGDKHMWSDYGQQWDTRQSFRKDFNPEMTKSRVLFHNGKKVN
jgi:hypothetical protein|tara:strand:+ start:309 stop:791 length:483 start_codon:yes stop_codon:yes gene_type:complete